MVKIGGHTSAGELVVHHQAEEDWDMEDGGVHEPLGAGVGFGVGGPEADLDEAGAGDQCAEEIEDAGKAHDGGQQADGNESRGVENDLAEGALAFLVHDGKHEDSGTGVIFAVHPGDGVEVRKLPDEENGEEEPSAGVYFAGGGGPADHRRDGSGNGADEGGPDSAFLERRVGEQIAEARENAKEARPEPGCEIEINAARK